MVRYVDSAYYSQIYKGNMPAAIFENLVIKAIAKINANTYGRLKDLTVNKIPEEVKLCACALCDKIYAHNQKDGKESETVGPHTVHYQSETSQSKNDEYEDLIVEFLSEVYLEDGTPLLFRGC